MSNYDKKTITPHLIFFLIMLIALNIVTYAQPVLAKSNDPVGDSLCAVIDFLMSRGFAYMITLVGMTVLGAQFLRGKMNPYVALVVCTGIIIIFYSRDILVLFGAGNNTCKGTLVVYESPFVDAMCDTIAILRTNTMRAVQVVAIIVMGIQYLRGVLDWGKTLIIITGIIVMMVAPEIILNVITKDSSQHSTAGGEACYSTK